MKKMFTELISTNEVTKTTCKCIEFTARPIAYYVKQRIFTRLFYIAVVTNIELNTSL